MVYWNSKGQGKGKMATRPWVQATIQKPKGKGKGKGKGKNKPLFSQLPEEQQKEIQEKWASRAEEEGRDQVDTDVFTGVVVWRCRSYGWIRPSNPELLPERVQESMASMTEELRGKATEANTDLDRFSEDVLYFRACDRAQIATKIHKDTEVNFKVYVDSKGAGAMEVETSAS